jgi:hypothetical protein
VLAKRLEHTWAIYRLAANAIYLGQVNALDEVKAIKIAIKELPVSNPVHQKRLVARKAGLLSPFALTD